MANLRTNNLCGEGGRNAYSGSVFFEGDSSYLALGSGVVSSFGTGDFTIEFWINQGVNAGNYTGLIALTSSTAAKRFETAIHSSTIHVYTDTATWRDTGYAPTAGVFEHIVFQRDYSGNTLKMYANGEEKWSVSNTRDYDEAWTTQIGLHGAAYDGLQGYLSNLRICIGHTVYSSNYFSPPTSPLTVHYTAEDDKTVLLCCQDSDDAAQEATGKTIIAYGYFGGDKGTGNLITNALDWDGATDAESSTMPTNWAAGNGATAEYDTGGTSGGGANRMLRLYNDGSNSYIHQTIPTVIGQRYFYNVWYRAKNSSLGVRISAGTSGADGTSLADSFNVGSANTEDTRTGFFTATATTTYFTLQIISGTNGASVYWDDVIVRAFNPKAPKVIPPYGTDAGNTFGGAISMNSSAWMYFPTGRTEGERGRGRGLIVANYIQPANYNTSEYITIQSLGNSIDFGDTSAAVRGQAVFASSTRAVSGSGYVAPSNVNTIEFFTIATQSNSTDFGDVTGGNGDYTPISNQTRGIFAGAYSYPAAFNAISFVTIATTGNSTDFGDMTTNRANGNRSAINSSTRGLIGGGYISPTGTNNIEFLTIATTGNSSDFGDLTSGRGNFTGLCSSTRGIFAGGSNPNNNIMDFVTIASAGDATDFGDMFTGNTVAPASTSNKIRGVIVGGDLQPSNAFTNVMQYITIATTGDSQDFGDMLTTGAYRNSTSDSHGGLS